MTQEFTTFRCPKCANVEHVRQKLLLIDKYDFEHFRYAPETRSACGCQGNLSVDGLKPEFVRESPLQQFVSGLYCEACGVGFVPDEKAKPSPPRWRLSPEGWHLVNSDGSLDPPQDKPR